MSCPRIVIAGTHSGTGKTTLSIALVGALRRRGLRVQTFKVGPDFLDPTYHAIASGRPCYNLDGWMTGREYVRGLFARATADADIAIIEGVMGLFDGADAATSEGSTAEIARWLDAPIFLVVNAHGVARSVAAMVKGFTSFEPDLNIAGVIANQCGSERHGEWLSDSLQSAALPLLVGAVSRGAFAQLPSRHLGLVTADSRVLPESVVDSLADAAERYLCLDEIVGTARSATPSWDVSAKTGTVPYGSTKPVETYSQWTVPDSCAHTAAGFCNCEHAENRVRIGVAHDEAFHFYYQDTFDEMQSAGCELVPFSPVNDEHLPEGLDGLYIGGGYPEASAEALSANKTMLDSIRRFAETNRPVYAECGGLMYLSKGLETLDGNRYPLVGVLPCWTRMREKKKALGYVEVTLGAESLWGDQGDVLRGHEFHYSEMIGKPSEGWESVYALKRRRSDEITPEGFQRGNILASYAHMHYASRPGALERFISKCEAARCVGVGGGDE